MSVAEKIKKKELIEREIRKTLSILAIEETLLQQHILIRKAREEKSVINQNNN